MREELHQPDLPPISPSEPAASAKLPDADAYLECAKAFAIWGVIVFLLCWVVRALELS